MIETDRRYAALLALFGLVVACTVMSASRWLMGDLASFWAMCCHTLGMVSEKIALWLTVLMRGTIVMMLILGFGTLLQRLWKTHCFVSRLDTASLAIPPMRLSQLFNALDLSRHVVVLATDVPLAFCVGLLRPRICLTTGLVNALTDKELKAVLLHEDHHRRHNDPLRGLMAEALAAVLVFLPIVAELRDLFLTTLELEADRHATRLAGRSSLAGALHKILTHPLATPVPQPVGISSLSATEIRIAELLGDRPGALPLSAHSLLTSSAIPMLGCMLTML